MFGVFRSACGCTALQQVSRIISNSDCINRAYRLYYSEKLTPKVFLLNGTEKQSLSFPYIVKELNNRSDFYILDFSLTKNGNKILLSEKNSSIEFTGYGLYHFSIQVFKRDLSFCKLKTEFIVYIDWMPFPHPTKDIVRVISSFLFGLIIFAIFLYQFRTTKKVRNFDSNQEL